MVSKFLHYDYFAMEACRQIANECGEVNRISRTVEIDFTGTVDAASEKLTPIAKSMVAELVALGKAIVMCVPPELIRGHVLVTHIMDPVTGISVRLLSDNENLETDSSKWTLDIFYRVIGR